MLFFLFFGTLSFLKQSKWEDVSIIICFLFSFLLGWGLGIFFDIFFFGFWSRLFIKAKDVRLRSGWHYGWEVFGSRMPSKKLAANTWKLEILLENINLFQQTILSRYFFIRNLAVMLEEAWNHFNWTYFRPKKDEFFQSTNAFLPS